LAAIVGAGETDYAVDYRAARAKQPDYVPPDNVSLAKCALDRALVDAGLDRSDVDGLSLSFPYVDAGDGNHVARQLGLAPRSIQRTQGIMAGVIPPAVQALAEGKCDVLACVYGVTSRAQGRNFGGKTYAGDGRFSYYYYHPWGWSSQAAHWALAWQYYMATFGAIEADLGAVAIQVRDYAVNNSNAIMRRPMTIEDYLSSRYIVRPLRLFDLCLVNDGGVCLILTRADRAAQLPHAPVLIAGWGHAELQDSKLRYLVKQGLGPQLREAGRQALEMAGLSLSDVQSFQGYDASTIHLINQLEGYGFVEPGRGLEFCKDGQMALDGSLPVNTSGGILSESYMHGWNHVVESVRQLRHECGDRQVTNIETSMYSLATTQSAHPIIFVRGA
jgi:acetyl-CoA acetyltransferase